MKHAGIEREDLSCQTKYPIVLIHGAGFRDLKWPVYWGRIPGALEKRGARVFYGLQDCWASTETNAREIVRRVDEIVGENDGLVSLSSARWGENFTVLRGSGRRGISHLDAIDLRRRPFSRRQGGVRDILEVYIAIASDLKARGL